MQSRSRSLAVLLGLILLLGAVRADAQTRRRTVRSAPAPGPQVTTFANIDRAVTEGRVSAEQGMLYKVFSIYGDARLPQDMRGDDGGLSDTTFMTDVATRFREATGPGRCRPRTHGSLRSNPESWFSPSGLRPGP